MANVSPIEIKNTAMTDAWVTINIEEYWNAAIIKMRETNVVVQIRAINTTNYFTLPIGESLSLSSYNFSSGDSVDQLQFKAASGTLEILGFVRGDR